MQLNPNETRHIFSVDANNQIIPIIPYEENDQPIHTILGDQIIPCGDPTCPCATGGETNGRA